MKVSRQKPEEMNQVDMNNEYGEFEHTLRLLLGFTDPSSSGNSYAADLYMMDILKHSIIVFLMKDRFYEKNVIFLGNTQSDFYKSLAELSSKHPELNPYTNYIKDFMEKYYPDIKEDYKSHYNDEIKKLFENSETVNGWEE